MAARRPRCASVHFAVRHAACSIIATLLCFSLGGCLTDRNPPPPVVAPAGDNPFSPVTLRVHPLTHVMIESGGSPQIICHVELRDAWGDSAKSKGMLTIRLFGPPMAAGAASTGGREINRWDVNLSDLETNAAMFDPATRTYRVQLTGGPQWLAGFAPKQAEGTLAPKISKAIVQATLTLGTDTTMSDDLVLSR